MYIQYQYINITAMTGKQYLEIKFFFIESFFFLSGLRLVSEHEGYSCVLCDSNHLNLTEVREHCASLSHYNRIMDVLAEVNILLNSIYYFSY